MNPQDHDAYKPKKYVQIDNPDWVKNATVYEVNIRQFSAEGTFREIEKQLPRLKEMGIDIIWLMPIHPIGELNRKGSLGSPYSVKDFKGINPEFGTEADFRNLVQAVHRQGMYVILDWVANHSSLDSNLVAEHPEFYKKSRNGRFRPTPWRDYDDIIELDYDQPELRKYMTEAMKYWVREFDIDGLRCDMASFVPRDFWENVRTELETLKPVFMLAEAEDRDLHSKAFDATYNWALWNHLHAIAQGRSNAKILAEAYLAEHVSIFPKEGIRLNFIDNHDKNSWEGNSVSNFGNALEAATVFTVLMDGMPLVYNGQEAGLSRSLKFFDRDPIEWKTHRNSNLYTTLFNLKHRNRGLWNGRFGGEMERVTNDCMEHIISLVREKEGDKVLAVFNLSPKKVNVTLDTSEHAGTYTELFSGSDKILLKSCHLELEPWGYLVLFRSNLR
ncbi:alpha-amylase family glycosyl hydrolase [Kaistella sp. PBT33-4]|uniref:alpha-amylase family glycosyl hydrolase n=1 Tax=Kaistella sp. PBT33-4 TaxID=3032000 RepID=UPI0023D7D3A9|nr:alpha-amylase family glycosyl hydrolase [Kaistella sp. PBT33-4]MDF0720482.1 alpha-amylase family glycosyl hydrolase [Kaistella sp. PBT33-4]